MGHSAQELTSEEQLDSLKGHREHIKYNVKPSRFPSLILAIPYTTQSKGRKCKSLDRYMNIYIDTGIDILRVNKTQE